MRVIEPQQFAILLADGKVGLPTFGGLWALFDRDKARLRFVIGHVGFLCGLDLSGKIKP